MKDAGTEGINILYIEDSLTNVDGVRNLLSRYKEYKFTSVGDLIAAERAVSNEDCDVILFDLGLPPNPEDFEPSIRFMQKVKSEQPGIAIIIFSAIANMELPNMKAALLAGVSYVVKEDIKKGDDLHKIISIARTGSALYTQAPASTFIEILQDNKSQIFTAREAQVADLIPQGLTNNQIAERLKISAFHARDLVSRIYKKSNTRSRTEFAIWYERNFVKK